VLSEKPGLAVGDAHSPMVAYSIGALRTRR
jgi:hypothetical protein